MIPFPGESKGIFYAVANGVDDTLGGDVVYRGAETAANAGSRALAAGDEWRAWVGSGLDYLDDPADCDGTPAWVVVVDSGSVTVAASEGPDPDYGNVAADAPTVLGAFTLTAGDNVIPSAFTVADVWGGDPSMMLRLVATSGSAVVSQVKMRVWPAGGPLGGWSPTQPAWDQPVSKLPLTGVFPDMDKDGGGSTLSANGAAPSDADAHAAMLADLAAEVGYANHAQAVHVHSGAGTIASSISASSDTVNALHGLSGNAALWLWQGEANPDSFGPVQNDAIGFEWVRIPTEVYGDPVSEADVDGSASWAWDSASWTITANAAGDFDPEPRGGYIVAADAGTWDLDAGDSVTASPTFAGTTVHAGGIGVQGSGSVAVPTGSRDVMMRATPSIFIDTPDFSGVHGGVLGVATSYSYGFAGPDPANARRLWGAVQHPSYRVWDPNGTAEPEPLQWWQRRDGDGMDGAPSWRAAGDSTEAGRWYGRQ